MKMYSKSTISLIPILFIAACTSMSVGPEMEDLKKSSPVVADYKEAMEMELATTEYTPWLQKDYKALALFEYDEMYDYDSARHFARKSVRAGKGEIPKPDAVSSRDIKAQYVQEATQMYDTVMSYYAKGKTYTYPKEMARLHVSYECWLEQIEEDVQPNHIMRCKDYFYDALSKMPDPPPPLPVPVAPIPKPASITIFFDTGSAIIAEAERQKIIEAINNPEVARTSIVVDGYTDTLDTSSHNMKLSQRRSESVKKALLEIDPALSNIQPNRLEKPSLLFLRVMAYRMSTTDGLLSTLTET